MKITSLINLIANLNEKGVVITDEQFEKIFKFNPQDIDALSKSNDSNHLKVLIYILENGCFDETLEKTITLANVRAMPKQNRDMLSKIFDMFENKKIELDERLDEFIYYISRISYRRTTDDSILNLLKISPLMKNKDNLVKMAKIFSETNPKLASKVATVIGSNTIREDKRLQTAKALGEAYTEENFQLAYNAAVYMGQKDNVDKIALAIANAKGLQQANLAKCVVANAVTRNNQETYNITDDDILLLVKKICNIPNEAFENKRVEENSFFDIAPEKIKFASLLAKEKNSKNDPDYNNKLFDLLLDNSDFTSFEAMYKKNPDEALDALRTIRDSYDDIDCQKGYIYIKKHHNNNSEV